jgi:hypothetical protein
VTQSREERKNRRFQSSNRARINACSEGLTRDNLRCEGGLRVVAVYRQLGKKARNPKAEKFEMMTVLSKTD